jgi:hypothetical protein
MYGLPSFLDPTAVIPPRVTTYRRDPGHWLDGPGVPNRDLRPVEAEFGARSISELRNFGDCFIVWDLP